MSPNYCGSVRNYLRRIAAPIVLPLLLLCAALTACSGNPSQAVLWKRCATVGGAHPVELLLPSAMPANAIVVVREGGMSVYASIDGGSHWSASPVPRIGTTVLRTPAAPRGASRLVLRTRDSAEIAAEVCAAALAPPQAGSERAAAADSFAAAGRATARLDWRAAYRLYARAARDSETARDGVQASRARHAMAAIAYWHLEQKRLARALASAALSPHPEMLDASTRSALITLTAMARMDEPEGTPAETRAALLPVLDRAQALAAGTFYGVREAPRLDILRGFIEYAADNFARATALAEQAARRCEALADWECYARARQNHVLSAEGEDYATALSEYHSALAKLDPALEPHLAADIWENLGGLQGLLALSSEGQRSYLAAIRLYASSSDCDGVRRSLSRLGSLLVEMGNPGDARELLEAAARRSCAQLLARVAGAPTIARLSNALDETQVPEADAQPCAGPQSRAAMSAEGRYAVFVALLYLGNSFSQAGGREAAERCFREARAYITDTHASLRYSEGFAAHRARYGDPAGAARLYQDMIQAANEAGLPARHVKRSVAALGLVRSELDEGRTSDALRRLAQAIGPIAVRGDAGQLIQALRLHAAAMRASHEDARAAASLRGAAAFVEAVPLSALEGEQRAAFAATQHDVFAEWTDLAAAQALADPSRTWDAFAVSERGRARSLRLALSQAPDATGPAGSEEDADYRKLLDGVRAAAGGPGFVRAWPKPLLERIAPLGAASPSARSIEDATSRALSDLKASLVEYAAGDGRLFAFVADGSGIRIVALGDLAPIRFSAAHLLDTLRNPEATRRSVEPAARALAQRIWWPIVGALTHERVIVVPDDSLYTVPFAVLPWSSGPDPELTLAHAELSSASSISVLIAALADRRPSQAAAGNRRGFELFGDSVTNAAEWNRECAGTTDFLEVRQDAPTSAALPGARREVTEAAAILRRAVPQRPVDLHLGCKATHRALEQAIATDPLLLHIATHGSIDASRPRLSALIMSSPAAEQSDFSVADILRRRMTTRLVVLSACETSAGQLLPGEGVLGPAQAFLEAGARTVIGSGWRVPDARTAELMTGFYAFLFERGFSASAALRAAQLALSSGTQSYAWAAFSVFGAPDARFVRE